MNKITYLFGAGASFNALPIVKNIPDRIKKQIDFLEKEEFILDSQSSYDDLKLRPAKSKRDCQIELLENLKWLHLESDNHASIDTFAKKLFIKGKFETLIKLKATLSVFFLVEQALNKPDRRYDTFFASILNYADELPETIRILSWNYDSQFEITFSEYSERDEISTNQNWLRVKTKHGRIDKDNGFGIFKLNGTTGLHANAGWQQNSYVDNLKKGIDYEFISKLVKSYTLAIQGTSITPSLSFAWEEERNKDNIVDIASNAIKDSVALVVIGYSFPFFNRKVDRKLLNGMDNLKRVYFQAPDADNLKERFEALRDDLSNIELIKKFDVEQFLLPNEL